MMQSEQPNKGFLRFFFLVLAVIAVAVGVYHATCLTFVNDDCFVSFRYAKNLVNGLGLVYNAEEHVEGFTNFLWTMLIALGIKLGIDPIPFSTTLGIISFAATILLYARLSWKFIPEGKPQLLWIPLTSLALCLHHDAGTYATSGLETSLFTFLISGAYAVILTGDKPRSRIGAGLLFTLAMLTRPEGVIFLGCALFYYLLTESHPFRSIGLLLLPVLLLFVPYWIWRFSYYGFFFPNTFYAKSIDLPYYSQGIEYTRLYFITYPVFSLLLLFGILAIIRRQKTMASGSTFKNIIADLRSGGSHPVLLTTLFVAVYGLFVVRIGGDFMFARFFIPITPMMYFTIERFFNRMTGGIVCIWLIALVLIATAFRYDQYRDNLFVGYIADEERFYTSVDPLQEQVQQANILKRHLGSLPVRVGFYARQLRLIYYLEPSFAVECSAGLTDTAIAHETISVRGRPGHEKKPTMEYLIRRGVQFYLGPTEPVPARTLALNVIVFDSIREQIITYNNAIMSRLEQEKGVTFIHLPEYLDHYLANLHQLSKQQVYQQYIFLKPFYFDVNNDTLRENAILRYLQ